MRKLPPLTAIRAFEAAARQSSFTRAALELCVTVTAVSHQIRQLEAYLGARLFERTPRAVILTEEGERIFPLLCEGFDRLGEAFALCSKNRQGESITVSTTRAFAERWLLPRLPKFHETFPSISVNIDASDEVIDLRAASADLAIRYGNLDQTAESKSILFRDIYLAVASTSGDTCGSRPRLDAFAHKVLLAYKWKNPAMATPNWKNWLARHSNATPEDFRVTWFSEETLALSAAERAMGPLICSNAMVADQLASGHLVPVEGETLPGFAFHLVEPPALRLRKSIARFTEWLREESLAFEQQTRQTTVIPQAV